MSIPVRVYYNMWELMGQYKTYLLCQVKPDCSDIKHMSHNVITYIIVHIICVINEGDTIIPPVSRPLKVYIMVLLHTFLTHLMVIGC